MPAVTVAATAPAFATSTVPSAGQAKVAFTPSSTDPHEAGEITVTNPSAEDLTVTLNFSPVPDEDTPSSLMSYSGFEGFTQVSTSTEFLLRGTIRAGQSTNGWCWWREEAGRQAVTTVTATIEGSDGTATPAPLKITIGEPA